MALPDITTTGGPPKIFYFKFKVLSVKNVCAARTAVNDIFNNELGLSWLRRSRSLKFDPVEALLCK